MDEIQQLALEAKEAFFCPNPGLDRRLGKALMRVSSVSPDWMDDLIDRVTGCSPDRDPWRVDFAYEALDLIVKSGGPERYENGADELSGDPDLSTLVKWLDSDPGAREEYTDSEMGCGHPTLRDLLVAAQEDEKREVYDIVLTFLKEKAKEESEVE